MGRPDSILGQFGSTDRRVKVNLLSPAQFINSSRPTNCRRRRCEQPKAQAAR